MSPTENRHLQHRIQTQPSPRWQRECCLPEGCHWQSSRHSPRCHGTVPVGCHRVSSCSFRYRTASRVAGMFRCHAPSSIFPAYSWLTMSDLRVCLFPNNLARRSSGSHQRTDPCIFSGQQCCRSAEDKLQIRASSLSFSSYRDRVHCLGPCDVDVTAKLRSLTDGQCSQQQSRRANKIGKKFHADAPVGLGASPRPQSVRHLVFQRLLRCARPVPAGA